MNPPLPEITCPQCNKIQVWRKQEACTSCGTRLSNWTTFNQLHKNLPLAAKLDVRP